MMKRKLALVLAALLAVNTLALTSCGEDKGTSSSEADNKEKEPVTITYGGWEGDLMMNELVRKFTEREENKHINIEIAGLGWVGNEKLTELAATDSMPDIINLENPFIPMQNDWVIDLKPYYEKDEQKDNLPQNFLKYGTINDKMVMIPSAIYIKGIFLNKTLLEKNNVPVPDFDWTVEEYIDVLQKTTKAGESIGATAIDMVSDLPAQMNDEIGCCSYNEKTQTWDLGANFQEAVGLQKELVDMKVSINEQLDVLGNPWNYEEGSTEYNDVVAKREAKAQELVGETDVWEAFLKGKMAASIAFTYDVLDAYPSYNGWDWDLYPTPVKEKGDVARPAIVVDSIAIASSCENPDAAWQFARYLSFADEIIDDRIEICKEQDMEVLQERYPELYEANPAAFDYKLSYPMMPATTNQESIDKWSEFNNAKPGVKTMFSRLDTGYVDGFKVTPGFSDAYFNTINKAITEEVYTGNKSIADIAPELEEKANAFTKEALDSVK